MAAGDEQDLIEAVVTCEGNLHDPDFQDKFRTLVGNLKSALYISKTKDPFRVRKIEPWNSVRVTISIPKEAAQKLKLLAQQGSNVLRSMGILSVQVEGDQVISLTWAAQNNEATQVILRQTSDEPAASSGTSGVSSSSLPASSPSISSISSSVASISSPVPLTPGSSAEASGMSVTMDMLSSSSSPNLGFRSPNVVAPSGEAIPVLPPKMPATGTRPALGGPFPFVSMTHAAQAIQRSELSPILSSNNVVNSNNSTSGSNAANSTNSIASSILSSSSSLHHHGAFKAVQHHGPPPPHGNIPVTTSNNTELTTPTRPSSSSTVNASSSTSNNAMSTVNVSNESQVTRLIIENSSGLNSATQAVGKNVASLGFSSNSNNNTNLVRSQAGPSQSLQLQLVNVPPPYPGVNTSSSNHSFINSSVNNGNVQSRNNQPQQASLICSNVGPISTTSLSSNITQPTTIPVAAAGQIVSGALPGQFRKESGGVGVLVNEGHLLTSTSNLSDSTSGGVLLTQPVSSPLLVNLLQNNEAASPSSSNADSHNQQQQLPMTTNVSSQPATGHELPARYLLQQQQQAKKTKVGVSLDGASSSVPVTVPKIESSPRTNQPGGAPSTESVLFSQQMPSLSDQNSSKVTMSRVNIPVVAPPSKLGISSANQVANEQSSTTSVLHGRTISQGNICILDQGSGHIRTIPLQPPPPYPSKSLPGKTNLSVGTIPPHSNDLGAAGSEHLTSLANGPTSLTPISSETAAGKIEGKSQQNLATVTLIPQTLEQQHSSSSVVESDAPKSTQSASFAADQSRTLLPITTVNIVCKSPNKSSCNLSSNNNSKDSDSTTFIPPPDPRLSSQIQKLPHGSAHSISAKNSSNLVVQTTGYNSDAKSSTSQLTGRTALINKRLSKDKTFPTGQIPSSGKPRQFLINPLTGHLEPMPNESSSESEEGDDGTVEGRKLNLHKAALSRTKTGPQSGGIHHRPLVTTETGVTVARVIKTQTGDQSSAQSLISDMESKKGVSGDITPSSHFGGSVMSVSKKARDDPNTIAALQFQKDSKDNNPSPATVTATSVTGEKIKLRLKLEKSEPISPAYKVDVSFVKKSEKTSMLPSSSTNPPSASSSGTTSISHVPPSAGSQPSSGEQPRVPPLHISLRGKNAAVVVSPRREEKDMPPPPSILGNIKDSGVTPSGKDISTSSSSESISSSLVGQSKSSSLFLNSHEGKGKSGGSTSTKRAKGRVKSFDGKTVSMMEKGSRNEKPKNSRPKLSKEVSTSERNLSEPLNQSDEGKDSVIFSMPVLQPAVTLPMEVPLVMEKRIPQLSVPPLQDDKQQVTERKSLSSATVFMKKEDSLTGLSNAVLKVAQASAPTPTPPLLPLSKPSFESVKDLKVEEKISATQTHPPDKSKSPTIDQVEDASAFPPLSSSTDVLVEETMSKPPPSPKKSVSAVVTEDVCKSSQTSTEVEVLPQLDKVSKGAFSSSVETPGSTPSLSDLPIESLPQKTEKSDDFIDSVLESVPPTLSPAPPLLPVPDGSSVDGESFVNPVINLSSESCDIKTGDESQATSVENVKNTGSENESNFSQDRFATVTTVVEDPMTEKSASGATPTLNDQDAKTEVVEKKEKADAIVELSEEPLDISDAQILEVMPDERKGDGEKGKVEEKNLSRIAEKLPNIPETLPATVLKQPTDCGMKPAVANEADKTNQDPVLMEKSESLPSTSMHETSGANASAEAPGDNKTDMVVESTDTAVSIKDQIETKELDEEKNDNSEVIIESGEELEVEVITLEEPVTDVHLSPSGQNQDEEDLKSDAVCLESLTLVNEAKPCMIETEGNLATETHKDLTPPLPTIDEVETQKVLSTDDSKEPEKISITPSTTVSSDQTMSVINNVKPEKAAEDCKEIQISAPVILEKEATDVSSEILDVKESKSAQAENMEEVEKPDPIINAQASSGLSEVVNVEVVEESEPIVLPDKVTSSDDLKGSPSRTDDSHNIDLQEKAIKEPVETNTTLVDDELVITAQTTQPVVTDVEPVSVKSSTESTENLKKKTLEMTNTKELETNLKIDENEETENCMTESLNDTSVVETNTNPVVVEKSENLVGSTKFSNHDDVPVNDLSSSPSCEVVVKKKRLSSDMPKIPEITEETVKNVPQLVPVSVTQAVPNLSEKSDANIPVVLTSKEVEMNDSASIESDEASPPVIMTPKNIELPSVATTSNPPISIVLPSNNTDKSILPKNAYKRRAEIKPGALQNALKRLHDNLPKVLKTGENQDPITQSSAVLASADAMNDEVEEVPVQMAEPVTVVKNTQTVGCNVGKPLPTIQETLSSASPLVTATDIRPNIIQRPKAVTAVVSSTPSQTMASAIHQITSGAHTNVLTNVSAGISSATLSSVASLSSSSGSSPQTVFTIHPNLNIPANFAQLQQSPVVLPGGHKMVPIKLVALPKQSTGQLQTIPIGNATPNRSSPNLLEAVNLVANAGSRSSSPKTTLIGSTMQSAPLNLSSVSLPVGGNLHFVPISVSSTTSNVKVLMTQPIKMQQAGLSQSMVVKSVLMGSHSQPTTIRLIRPSNLQDPIAIQTLIKQPNEQITVNNQSPKQKVEVTLTESAAKPEVFSLQAEALFKKLDGVEIVETGSPLNNDELPFEADIIHDEKDLADVLAAEAKNEIVENCTTSHVNLISTGTFKKEETITRSETLSKTAETPKTTHVVNHVSSKKLLNLAKEEQDSPSSLKKNALPSLTYSLSTTATSTKNSRANRHSTLSPIQDPNGPDIHGEDPEIINSFARSPNPHVKVLLSDAEVIKTSGSRTDLLPDHTYGATNSNTPISLSNCDPNCLKEELSIEIPINDIEMGALSPSQHPTEEKRCTRSTRSNTRLSPDITAFVSDTPKSSKLTVKGDSVALMKNSPKQSPTGSLKVLSPTPSSLTITPSTSTRSSPVLHNQHQVNTSNAAATINAVALGIIDKIQGNANAQGLKNSRITKLTGGTKRKRQESDSSSASRDENMEEKTEVDLNSRPGKRKCSENAAEMIKVCIGVEDSPKRSSSTFKKSEDTKAKESKGKRGMATVVEDDDDADSEVSLTRGRSGRSSRESSEDRSSSRGSSVQRVVTSVEKPKSVLGEETPKETKSSRLNSRGGREGSGKSKIQSSSQSSSTSAKKSKETGKTTGRRSNRPVSKDKSPLTPAKTRTNVRKDIASSQIQSEKGAASTPTSGSNPENENARRKTRSSASAAGKRHVT